ncbi:hypothetical protein ACFQ08_18170 [Streptosporangium algeriense]|uniref:Uncharacterized protein n=1 Tax=Streptosporangium algeriense TaxID=1682748 RepID=A0ABW3DRN3_9ACTN
MNDPWLGRILREGAAPEMLEALAERLSPTDLQTLLMAVHRRRTALRERVLDRLAPEHPGVTFVFDDGRATGRGYYTGVSFGIDVTTPRGEILNLGDGGFTTWTAALLGNAKERLLISGLGIERLCGLPPG